MLYKVSFRTVLLKHQHSQENKMQVRLPPKWGSFYVTMLRDRKPFPKIETSTNFFPFYIISRVRWTVLISAWTSFLAVAIFKIIEEDRVKNVTALRLDKPNIRFVMVDDRLNLHWLVPVQFCTFILENRFHFLWVVQWCETVLLAQFIMYVPSYRVVAVYVQVKQPFRTAIDDSFPSQS